MTTAVALVDSAAKKNRKFSIYESFLKSPFSGVLLRSNILCIGAAELGI